MLFNSFEFIFLFLPTLCLFFRTVQNNLKIALWVLFLASLIFYANHSIFDLNVMLASILINFLIGQYVFKNKKILWLGVLFNIGIIAYFKYSYFIFENLKIWISISIEIEKNTLPLGISFFTFQQIAYLVDTYYKGNPEKSFLKHGLLVSFFPHSIAGPLVQYKEIGPQFNKVSLSWENIAVGATIFIIGLFKKVIIADGLAPCANAVFNGAAAGLTPSFFEAWLGAICYTLQLYFDFSGYSDMAMGLAKIFNITFPLNFDSPYKANSIIDFWRRWHITLSQFLKNYLYIPLGGNQKGVILRYRNVLITMLIGGLWHGANWTFVLWGALHGFYLVINHTWRAFCQQRHWFMQSKIYPLFAWFLTILSVIFAWVVFRASDLKSTLMMYQSMLGFNGISLSPALKSILPSCSWVNYNGFFVNQWFYYGDYLPLVIGAICIILVFPNIKWFLQNYAFNENKVNVKNQNAKLLLFSWSPSKRYAMLMALMTGWVILALLSQRKIDFLYFNF